MTLAYQINHSLRGFWQLFKEMVQYRSWAVKLGARRGIEKHRLGVPDVNSECLMSHEPERKGENTSEI